MFKVLVALVVSMTTTTVLLSQLEPVASRNTANPPTEQIRQVVRSAVASADAVVPDDWKGVEIVLEREVAVPRRDALAAIPDAGDYHFWIEGAGGVSSSPAWRAQRPAPAGQVIRIALADSAQASGIPGAQWTALLMLLNELHGVLEPVGAASATGGWITLSDEAASDATLHEHLRLEGLLG